MRRALTQRPVPSNWRMRDQSIRESRHRASWRQEKRPACNRSRKRGNNFTEMGLGRVELPTSRLSGVRSNQLSYRPLPNRQS